MHELSIASNIIEIAEDNMPKSARLKTINVSIGPLAGICPDSLQFCFDELAVQKSHNDVTLLIKNLKAEMKCLNCNKQYKAIEFESACPVCASLQREIISGTEFSITSIEVEEKNV